MRVLVTGGAGFLGAWVIRRLIARDIDVRSLDVTDDASTVRSILGSQMDRVDWRQGDVSQASDVEAASRDCSGIIHIAGLLTPACRADPVRGATVNLIGTLNVFEAAKRAAIAPVIYASSASVFGPDDAEQPRPISHYGAFKLAGEGSARAYWADDGIASVGLRPLVIYGPGRHLGPSAGITLACRAVAEGQSYTIPFSGRSGFVYVDDVAAACEAALLNPRDGAAVYNFWGEVADVRAIVAELGRLDPAARITAEGEPLPIPADVESAEIYRAFPALQRTPLNAGLAATIAYYRTRTGAAGAQKPGPAAGTLL